MPDKTKPKKAFPYIQIRIEPNIKDLWIKFVKEHSEIRNMTHLITASVERFIESYGKPQIASNGNTKEMLAFLMEESRKKDEQLTEALKENTEIRIALANKTTKDMKDEEDLTDRIFEMISEGSFNTSQIASILKINEKRANKIVNDLIKQGSIEHDTTSGKQRKWRVKE